MFKNEFYLFYGTNLRKYAIMKLVAYSIPLSHFWVRWKKELSNHLHMFWKINWLIVHENKTSEREENEKKKWKLQLDIRNIIKLRK